MAFGLGLAGLMGGVGGLGLGMQDYAQRQYEANQFNQRLALAQREQDRLDREEAAREQAQWVSGDSIRALSGMLGVAPPEGAQIPDRLQASVMPAVLNRWGELQKEAAVRRNNLAMANALDPQELGPGVQGPMQPPDPLNARLAQMYRSGVAPTPQEVQMFAAINQRNQNLARNKAIAEELLQNAPQVTRAEDPIPGDLVATLSQTVDPRYKMMAAAVGGSDQPLDIDALSKLFFLKEQGAAPIKVGEGETLVTPRGQTIFQGPPKPIVPKTTSDTITTSDGIYRYTFDETGKPIGRERIGDPPAKEVQQGAAYVAAVEEYLRNPTPANKAKVDLLKPQIVGPGAVVSGPTDQGLVNPAPPSPSERTAIANYDYVSNSIGSLLDRAASPEIKPFLGGLATNPVGRLRRAGEETLGLPTTTDAWRQFNADKGIVMADARKVMLGLRQTNYELAGLAPALPNENDPGFVPKLAAWKTWADRNRDAINSALSGVQIKVPPRPGGGGGGPGTKADPMGIR